MSRWKACAIQNCLRQVRKYGLCEAHYQRSQHRFGLQPELPIGGYIKKRQKVLSKLGWMIYEPQEFMAKKKLPEKMREKAKEMKEKGAKEKKK